MKRDPLLLDGFFFIIVTLIGIVIGLHPLVDADVGWHLAGGLWILETGRIPTQDIFGAQQNFWLCYSWFPELIFAIVYRTWGFSGLQCFQVLSVLSCVWLLLWILRQVQHQAAQSADFLQLRLSENLAMFVAILFVVPVWHLRPQLFSVMLFALTVFLAEARRLTPRNIVLIGILWANIHVYWLFLPLVVFAYSVLEPLLSERRATMSGLLLFGLAIATGVVNPYGFGFLKGLTDYAFHHSSARILIAEFQPLSLKHGYILWLLVGVGLLFLTTWRQIKERERPALIFLLILFALAATQQIKFVPLFGILASLILTRTTFPRLLSRWRGSAQSVHWEPRLSGPQRVFVSCMLLVFSIVCGYALEVPEAIASDKRELIALVRDLIVEKKISTTGNTSVLNHFDDGGWLSLAFWLMRPAGKTESPYKVAIDGRTLVVGEERLKDFDTLRRLQGTWCEVIDKWKVKLAILPTEFRLTQALTGEYAPQFYQPCSGRWKVIQKTPSWTVLEPLGKGVKMSATKPPPQL